MKRYILMHALSSGNISGHMQQERGEPWMVLPSERPMTLLLTGWEPLDFHIILFSLQSTLLFMVWQNNEALYFLPSVAACQAMGRERQINSNLDQPNFKYKGRSRISPDLQRTPFRPQYYIICQHAIKVIDKILILNKSWRGSKNN